MARSVARTTSPVPQGRGAPQRHSTQNNERINETNDATARTGRIDRAWPENGPSTDLAVGTAGRSNGGPNNPHASGATLANAERREVRRAVPLFQGTGANIWGTGPHRIPTTGSHPPATDAATTALRGLAPIVLGQPPPRGVWTTSDSGEASGGRSPKGEPAFGGIEGDTRREETAAAVKIQAAWRGYDVQADYVQLRAAWARLDRILLLASLPGSDKDKLMEQVAEVEEERKERAWRKRGPRGEEGKAGDGDFGGGEGNGNRGACAATAAHSGGTSNGDSKHRGACAATAAHSGGNEGDSKSPPRAIKMHGDRPPEEKTDGGRALHDRGACAAGAAHSRSKSKGDRGACAAGAAHSRSKSEGDGGACAEEAAHSRSKSEGDRGACAAGAARMEDKGGSAETMHMHGGVKDGGTGEGREEALAATKIQAMWRGYSVHEDHHDAIEAGALFCFLDAYCDDSDGWSAMSDGSSVGSEGGEPAVFKDIHSARKFIDMLPAEIRQHVEMVAVDDGSTIPSAATSPPTRSGTTAALEGEDGGGGAPESRALHSDCPGIEEDGENFEAEKNNGDWGACAAGAAHSGGKNEGDRGACAEEAAHSGGKSNGRDDKGRGVCAATAARSGRTNDGDRGVCAAEAAHSGGKDRRAEAASLMPAPRAGGLSERRGVYLEAMTQGTPGQGEKMEDLRKEAQVVMKPRLVTPDSDAPIFWQPEEMGRPPTPWEAGDDWGQGRTESRPAQHRFRRERRRDHAKGDVRQRSEALGDIAEANRVFALRLAGLSAGVFARAA